MTLEDLDFEKRDPNDLNDHLRVRFDDVIGEPDGAHSCNCVWKNSYKCFDCCKGCCYKLMTAICAIPLSIMWGCGFACVTCVHVWEVTPCMRCYMINCGCCQKFWGTCLQCAVQPCCEALSYFLSNIRVTKSQG